MDRAFQLTGELGSGGARRVAAFVGGEKRLDSGSAPGGGLPRKRVETLLRDWKAALIGRAGAGGLVKRVVARTAGAGHLRHFLGQPEHIPKVRDLSPRLDRGRVGVS